MKQLIIHKNGIVVFNMATADDVGAESIAVVNDIPEFVTKNGYSGVLCYNEEKGVHWRYDKAANDEKQYTITDVEVEEAYQEGVQST